MPPPIHDPELDALAAESDADAAAWHALAADVRGDASTPLLPADFNARLRAAVEADAAPRPAVVPQSPRWRRIVPRPLATAAAVALLVSAGVYLGRDPAPAWGDVVRAAGRVEQCHVSVFVDDPRRGTGDDEEHNPRLDWYYQRPGTWRAHAFGRVAFASGGTQRVWDVAKSAWTPPDAKNRGGPLPRELVQAKGDVDILTATLRGVFDGQVPPGEPVKSDDVAAASGIDVFDYARDAGRQWARIWVIRDSKLPLRMHVYMPESDSSALIDFDYSDPQSPGFFDADAYAKAATAAAANGALTPRRAYAIGQRPTGGRPRGSSQVFETTGGYKSPVVRKIAADADGDVLVVSTDVRNVTPTGQRPHQEHYDGIVDNWGNRYILFGGRGDFKTYKHWFMPLPPFKRGAGQRMLTLPYVLQADHDDRPQTLRQDTLAVPDPSTDAADFPAEELGKRAVWYMRHVQENGTLPEQLAEIDRRLAADANDLDTLVWKFKLLRKYDRDAAAFALFEASLHDRVFADAAALNTAYVSAGQYLLFLYANGRDAEAADLSAKAAALVRQAAEAEKATRRRPYDSLTRNTDFSPLAAALAVPAIRERAKAGPTVLRAVASRDGYVFVELQIPPFPTGWNRHAVGFDGEAPLGWYWQPTAPDAWRESARWVRPAAGRLWKIYKGAGPTLPLSATVTLAADNMDVGQTRNDVKLTWHQDIAVPAPTVDKMIDWTASQSAGDAGNDGRLLWYPPAPAVAPAPPPAERVLADAETAFVAGQWQTALDAYDRAMAMPKDQWSAYLIDPKTDPDYYPQARRQNDARRAECLARLGRWSDARAVADALWATLPPKPDLSNYDQAQIAADAFVAELSIARARLAAGDAKAAMADLNRTAAHRPDLSTLPETYSMVDRGPYKTSFQPRSRQQTQWQKFDAVWWNVRDAVAGATTQPTVR